MTLSKFGSWSVNYTTVTWFSQWSHHFTRGIRGTNFNFIQCLELKILGECTSSPCAHRRKVKDTHGNGWFLVLTSVFFIILRPLLQDFTLRPWRSSWTKNLTTLGNMKRLATLYYIIYHKNYYCKILLSFNTNLKFKSIASHTSWPYS